MEEEFRLLGCLHLKRERMGYRCEKRGDYYSLLHFINPVDITLDGKEFKTGSNACVIYTPGAYRRFCASDIDLFHNFLLFQIRNDDVLLRRGLPLNTLFYTDYQEEITRLVETIAYFDTFRQDSVGKKSVNDAITSLFDTLAEEQNKRITAKKQKIADSMEYLRTLIYMCPRDWDVQTMANYVHFGRAYFSVRYKETYGISPGEDLIRSTIRYADKLLQSTDQTVAEISAACGYPNTAYFISLYKSRKGMTPEQFRNSL